MTPDREPCRGVVFPARFPNTYWMVWTSRLNVEEGELFAELSLYCRGRCAGFPYPLLGWLGGSEPHGHEVSLWHFDRQHYSVPDSWVCSYAAGQAAGD